jgi:four helix bundle protein
MKIESFRELRVYQAAIEAAVKIFELTIQFPAVERYSMTDQIRRSSRSVCTNIAETWRRRRYKAAFIAKLNDSETEATETQVWLEIALRSKYISQETHDERVSEYEQIIGQIVVMIDQHDKWVINPL